MIKLALVILFAASSTAFAQSPTKTETFTIEGGSKFINPVTNQEDETVTFFVLNGNANNSAYCTPKISTLDLFHDYYEESYVYMQISYETCLKIKEKALQATKVKPAYLTITPKGEVFVQ